MRKRPSAPAAAGEEQNIADGQPHRGILSTIFIELGWAVAEFALLVVGTGLLDLYVDTRNIYCVIIGTTLPRTNGSVVPLRTHSCSRSRSLVGFTPRYAASSMSNVIV